MTYYVNPTGNNGDESFFGHVLEWRTEPPTEPGFYFVDLVNGRKSEHEGKILPTMVFFMNEKEIHGFGTDRTGTIKDHFRGTSWLGPLPVPEMPR